MKKIILIIVVIALASFVFPSCTVNDDFSDVEIKNSQSDKAKKGKIKPD